MTVTEKPFAPACERNQAIILQMLQQHLRFSDKHILEIGSGTGQHAAYFGENLPQIIWQTSDVRGKHNGINMWLQEAKLNHVLPPIEYQIGVSQWPVKQTDVVFSANIVHIISEALVKRLIQDLGKNLQAGNRVMFYGPFKYNGKFTADSNAEFDLWLKDIDRLSGIRDFEVIENLMLKQSFVLINDIQMPANNQLLLFEMHSETK